MILEVNCSYAGETVYAKSLYQYDKNVVIRIDGIEIPPRYIGYFSNTKDLGLSVMRENTSEGMPIPNELLMTGEYVYANIFAVNVNNKRQETMCRIIVPVIRQAIPIPIMLEDQEKEIVEYTVDPDGENLEFLGSVMNNIIDQNKEEEDS